MEKAGSQLSRYGAIASSIDVAPSAKVFFVLSTSSALHGDLQSEFPVDKDGVPRVYGTINAAIAACVDGRGDVIYVMPGHTETITAAAGIVCDKSGIRIQGMGEGSNRPTINFTTSTAADINIDAANVTIDNVIFDLTGVDALVAPIDVNAADFTLSNCYVLTADATGQATLAILTDANASRMKLVGNLFLGSANAGTAAAVRIVGGDGHVIENNVFIGDYTTTLGAIDNVTTACTNTVVKGNNIFNRTASSTKAMVFVAASTGVISNNDMQILSGTAPITGAAMSWVGGNYYAATIGAAGTLI